jgi:hypothetical protein
LFFDTKSFSAFKSIFNYVYFRSVLCLFPAYHWIANPASCTFCSAHAQATRVPHWNRQIKMEKWVLQ